MISHTGGLLLTSPSKRSASIEPFDGGFDKGAMVTVDTDSSSVTVRLSDSTNAVHVSRPNEEALYYFDPDTGAYIDSENPSRMDVQT